MNPRERILQNLSNLTPELMRSAQFVLDNEQELLVLSMRAFAQKVGVKPATLLRLAKTLKYSGWVELKDDFIVFNGLRNNGYSSKAQEIVNHFDNSLYNKSFESQIRNLIATQEINKPLFNEFVECIESSTNIYICGFRASFPIAWSIFYVYKLFNKNITLIDGLGSNLEIYLRELLPTDTIILIGFEPYSREILSVIDVAKEIGSKILGITDKVTSPLAVHSTSSLFFSVESPSFFPSISSGLGISEALLANILARNGQNAVDQIKKNEMFLKNHKVYITS